jgi:lysophospholipase L1-like esterase
MMLGKLLLGILLFQFSVLHAGEGEIRIVTLGDSITRGVRAGVKLEETFSVLLQDSLQKKKINARVINVGIGGERTDQALARLAKGVVALKPNVVTIMYGTNDSYVDRGQKEPRLSATQYEENLRKLIAQLREAGAKPVLMTPPRWGDKAKNGIGENPNVRLGKYVEVCRKVAKETKTPLIDHFAYWSEKAKAGVDIGTWTTDQCHPNPRGHREIGELMMPIVVKTIQKSK